MNAFEEIIAKLLNQEGYWTRTGYKVNLSPPQKAEIGIPSMPRPEIDILAYNNLYTNYPFRGNGFF